jgi:hypothetical protein
VLGERRRPGHPRDRPVGDGAGQLEHLRSERSNQHRYRRQVGDVERGVRRDRLTVDVALAAAQERHEHVQVLAHVPHRLRVRQAEHVLDDNLVRQPDTEREPAPTRGLHGQRLLRHRDRMARVRRHHTGQELDPRNLVSNHGQHAHGVEAEDLGECVAREAVLFGLARRVDDLIDTTPGGSAEDPDAHNGFLAGRDAKRLGTGRAGPETPQRTSRFAT